jgi:hypothetical protein
MATIVATGKGDRHNGIVAPRVLGRTMLFYSNWISLVGAGRHEELLFAFNDLYRHEFLVRPSKKRTKACVG